MTHRPIRLLALILAFAMSLGLANAELRLGRFYGDDMVLQRDRPVLIRGIADKGAEVTVTFAGQSLKSTAGEDGAWSVTLDAMPANAKGAKLRAKAGKDSVSIDGVLVGDVWLVARQTSIDISLGRDAAGKKAAAAHKKNAGYRACVVKTVPATAPQSDLAAEATSGWSVVDEATALQMSGAGYYFGRDLSDAVDVPVGVIDLNMGHFFPVGWLSRETQLTTTQFYGRNDVEGNIARMEELAELSAKGEPKPRKEVIASEPKAYALYPAAGYNAVIHPLKGVALKGVVLQLGGNYPYMIYADLEKKGTDRDRPELNRAYVETYNIRKVGFRMDAVTTPRIPREWRTALGDEHLPMGLVVPPSSGLSTLAMHGREMRELLRLTAEDNPGTGVILPGYEYIPFSAQPSDEALLGARSLQWALGAVYKQAGAVATGPLFERIEADMNTATVHFKPGTAEGLRAAKGSLDAFEAAGADGVYTPAEATIEGNVIRLKSDVINRISHVRYNWKKAPDQGLVNAAGLPAAPFRSEKAAYDWFVTNKEADLPIEYSTPANEWRKSDVTLVNGQLKTHGYGNFTGWLGPIGIKTGPFGPNMGVREVLPGSPADGKIFVGDVIYSANGAMLGDKAWEVMGAAITHSETEEGAGELVLGIRRTGKNVDVEITLEVMGTYSSTAPYDCPKTEKIVTQLEEWLVARGAGAGFLNSDALFLLGSGNPEYQGLVRRLIYGMIAGKDPTRPIDPLKAGKSWHNSAEAILLGEYYHATGDRNVLPHLKHVCDRLAATQHEQGGWRHNYPGGAHYGLIPNAGLPGVMGMYFAHTAGLDINMEKYKRGVDHFRKKRAETGFLIYGLGGCERDVPAPIDPATLAAGKLTSYNGGLSAAGILMGFEGYDRAAHLCSFISAYAWNNTFGGHGGNFWNNFWTPLGANAHGRPAFINFMKNHRWYRECNRMYDGSLIIDAQASKGGGPGLALVAPRKRLRITGAPLSPFAVDAPEVLKPAVAAHAKRDYAECQKIVDELLASGTVVQADLPRVQKLADEVRLLRASIEADLSRMGALIEEGKVYEASLDIAQLEGVMHEGDKRLAAVEKAIADAGGAAMQADKERYANRLESLVPQKDKPDVEPEVQRDWRHLVTAIGKDKSKGQVSADAANMWRLKVVEGMAQAPEGWVEPRFDDADWRETELPISWRMYHTALLRTTFDVEDKKAFDKLRLQMWCFRQQGIEIYLNGALISKVNNIEKKTGNIEAELNDSALKLLKNGKNTLAITTRHNWRWGMLFMRVYNDGFDFRLAAREKLDD